MLTLTTLDASNRGISDLGGLHYATNLTGLNLDSNALTDITPIAGLTNLTELDLASNPISDFRPLASLTNLTRLILLDTQMTDASALSGLTGLTYLHLSDNRLSSIAPLGGLSGLTYLQLANNQISDISPLAGMTGLQTLYLNENQVADISTLAGLPSLNLWCWPLTRFQASRRWWRTPIRCRRLACDAQHGHRPQRGVNGLADVTALKARGVWVGHDPLPLATPSRLRTRTLRPPCARGSVSLRSAGDADRHAQPYLPQRRLRRNSESRRPRVRSNLQ